MKKLYSFIIASVLAFTSLNVKAVNIPIAVANFNFTPSSFTANVGDVLVFTVTSGTHQVQSMSGFLPAGAAPISSPTMSTGQQYSYTITASGNYAFQCTIHTSMAGDFQVTSPAGIVNPTAVVLTSVYPSPFKEKLNVKYNGIESIEFFNIVGEKIISVNMTSAEGKLEVETESLPAGVYFYRTYKDGAVFETRKIVKAK